MHFEGFRLCSFLPCIDEKQTQIATCFGYAEANQVLKAVLLRPTTTGRTHPEPIRPIDPANFPNRQEYRKALLEDLQKKTAFENEETLRQLHGLDLNPHGGTINHAVVVEGPASRLLGALDLPGVGHATLDQPIAESQPRRPNS